MAQHPFSATEQAQGTAVGICRVHSAGTKTSADAPFGDIQLAFSNWLEIIGQLCGSSSCCASVTLPPSQTLPSQLSR